MTEALTGKVCITRPSGGSIEDEPVIKLEIKDDKSGLRFLTMTMKPADFALALTGLSYVPATFELRGSENVGKVKEIMRGRFVVPREEERPGLSKDDMRQMLRNRCQKEGWFLDDYIGSQGSVTKSEDGGTTINFNYYRYVEEALHAE